LKNHLSTGNNTTNGIINPAFSTDTLYNQLPIIDSTPSTTTIPPNPSIQQQRTNENWRNIFSIIYHLMKNTRYVFIVIANLFEGVLLKGRFLV
jgi:hypothetical protein